MKILVPKGTVYIEDLTIAEIISHIINKHDYLELTGSIKDHVLKMITGKGKKGIFVTKEEKEVQIDIHVMLYEMTSFFSKCTLLQEEIKKEVEWMTGLGVKAVNIHIEKLLLNSDKE